MGSVVGIPDDIRTSNYEIGERNYIGINYDDNDFYNVFNWDDSSYNMETDILTNHSDAYKIREYYYNVLWATGIGVSGVSPKLDYQRDIYQFNFFGNTGRFAFFKKNGILVPKIIGDDSKLNIEVFYENLSSNSSYPTVIDYFKITDTNGFIYTFDVVEETLNKTTTFTYSRSSSETVPVLEEIPAFRSAWKLSNVSLAHNNLNIVSFTYKDVIEEPKNPSSSTIYKRSFSNNLCSNCDSCETESFNSALKPHSIHTNNDKTINSKKIQEILFNDGIKLIFNSSLDHPEYNGEKLNQISINDENNNVNKTIDFTYNAHMQQYVAPPVFGSPSSEHNHALLFLDQIKVNNSNQFKYVFDYENIEKLLAFGENPKDNFGYYHKNIPFYERVGLNANIHKTDALLGALKSIVYPTKGKRLFNWQSNTYSYNGNRLLSFEEIFTNPDNYIIQDNFRMHATYTNQGSTLNQSTPQIININIKQKVELIFNFLFNDSGQASQQFIKPYNISFYFVPVLSDGSEDSTREIVSRKIDNYLQYSDKGIKLLKGQYQFYIAQDPFMEVDSEYNQSTLSEQIKVNINIYSKELKSGSLNWFNYGGGLRIKSIEDIDNEETKIKTKYNYALETIIPIPNDYPENMGLIPSSNPTHYYSSGSMDGLTNLIRKYSIVSRPLLLIPQKSMSPIHYDVEERLNELEAQLTQGSYIGYKDVSEYKISGSEMGNNDNIPITNKSITKNLYDSAIDYPSYPAFYGYPFSYIKKQDYLRGNLRKQSVYNKNNQLVKERSNIYNFDIENNIEKVVGKFLFRHENETILANVGDDTLISMFFIGNGQNLEIPNADYSNLGTLALSYSHVMKTSYSSFDDFYINNSNNLQESSCSAGYGSPTVKYFLENFVIPKELFTKLAIEPLTVNNFSIYDESSYKVHLTSMTTKDYFYPTSTSSPNITETKEDYTYNLENYQLEAIETTDSKNAIYKKEMVYATPNYNASAFNSEENVLINEMINQNFINIPILTKTYKNSSILSTTQSIYKHGKPYKIKTAKKDNALEERLTYHSYDVYGNPLDISKADGVHVYYVWGYNHSKPIAKIEHFTAYATGSGLHPVIDPTTEALFETARNLSNLDLETDLTIALNAIRTALPNSMVTTMTYKPLIGVSTVTDPKGDIQYFTYDTYNRLQYVKDKEGNILKKNDYHYKIH